MVPFTVPVCTSRKHQHCHTYCSPRRGTVVVPLIYASRRHRHCHRYCFAKKWYSSGFSTVPVCASQKHRHCQKYCFAKNRTVAVRLQYGYAPAGHIGTVMGIFLPKNGTAVVQPQCRHVTLGNTHRYCSPKSGAVVVPLQCRCVPAGNTGTVIGTVLPKSGTVMVPLQYRYVPARNTGTLPYVLFCQKVVHSSGSSIVPVCANRKHRHRHRYCFAKKW